MASNRDSDIIHVKIDVLIDRFALLDSTRDDILFFQPDGTSISTLKIDLPSGNWQAAFWYNDLVYVLEDFFNRVRVFDIYGTEQTSRKIELGFGSWVGGVELGGKLWLIDDSDSELRAFNPDDGTEFTSDAFDVGRANGAYAYNGNIYVIDNIGREVEVWSPAGVEQTALGFNLGVGAWWGGLEFEGHSYLIDNFDLRAFDASGTEQESRNFDLPNNGFRGAFRFSSTAIAAKWSTIPDQDFNTSRAVDLDLTDYLSGDPDFTFTVTGLPSGLTLSAEGVLSGTPTTAGAFTVNITASNNGGSESTSFAVDVSDVVAPVWSTIPNQSVSYNGSISFDLNDYVTGEDVTITASGLPSGITLSNAGVLSGSSLTNSGTSTVTVTATNDAGSVSTTFTIVISVISYPTFYVDTSSSVGVGTTGLRIPLVQGQNPEYRITFVDTRFSSPSAGDNGSGVDIAYLSAEVTFSAPASGRFIFSAWDDNNSASSYTYTVTAS